ncbi:hypothetical protein KAX35_08360 [candidate division WOR-3 bacterium]|nr:hypothetical protein [candidate division WOR-3 bacterium]
MSQNMIKGRKEARIGLDSEKDIIRMINTNKQFNNSIKQCLNKLGFDIQSKIKAQKDDIKTDIYIEDNSKIGVSIKSSTVTSFHHLDRRRLESWKEFLDIPDDIFKTIKEAILRVSHNSRDKFIQQGEQINIKEFYAKNVRKIIDDIFIRGEKDLKLFMINNKIKHKLYLLKIEEVVKFLVNNIRNNINFSSKGIIRLGDFITVQRKGGDGSHITIPKTDWEHPGNQLQFKFSPLKFAEYIEKNKPIRICSIKLY